MIEHSQPTSANLAKTQPAEAGWGCWLIPVCFFGLLFTSFHWLSSQSDILSKMHSGSQQEVYYDNLASSLARGDGFELNFQDDSWADYYSQNSHFDWMYGTSGIGKTSRFAPGFPAVLSVVFRMSHRDWETIRAINCFALVTALTILIVQIRMYFGWIAAITGAVTIGLDAQLHQSAYRVTSESLSTTLMIICFCFILNAWNSPIELQRPSWRWPVGGACLGMLTLLFWQANYWIPVIVIGIFVVLIVQAIRRRGFTRVLQAAGLFLIGLVVVAAPWWVRNCRVTQEFEPFGKGMAIHLMGAYCEHALSDGNLDYSLIQKKEDDLMTQVGGEFSSQKQYEKKLAAKSLAETSAWIEANSERLSSLFLTRAMTWLGLNGNQSPFALVLNYCLLIGGLLGAIVTWRRYGWVVAVFFFLTALTVVLTWTDSGRFYSPMRPLLHASLAGLVGSTLPLIFHRSGRTTHGLSGGQR